jgi:hypothetical protein
LNWANRKDNLRAFQELQDSEWKIVNSFERLLEKGELLGCPAPGLLREISSQVQLPGYSEAIATRFQWNHISLGIIHMMLMYKVFKIQELQGHGDFQPYFKGRPVKPSNVWQGGSPLWQPLRGQGVKL